MVARKKRLIMGVSDDLPHSLCASFRFKAVFSSMDARYPSITCSFEQPLLLSTTIYVGIPCKKWAKGTPPPVLSLDDSIGVPERSIVGGFWIETIPMSKRSALGQYIFET